MKLNQQILLIVTAILAIVSVPSVQAGNINIVVKTVLASGSSLGGAKSADPRLSDLIRELESVFRYSSYQLLSQNAMNLNMNQTGAAPLPEDRVLKITPIRITGNRGELQLVLFKNDRQIFQTVIQLLNNGMITVGGPEYKGGYLLFNISVSF